MFITFKQTNALWISTRAMYNYKRIRILIAVCITLALCSSGYSQSDLLGPFRLGSDFPSAAGIA